MELLIEIVGFLGVAVYVLSYALLQTGVIKGNGYLYPAMNLAGATFVAVSLLNNWNLWQLLISILFATFSIIGMTRVYLANRKLHFSDKERELHRTRFGMLTRGDMRRLLDAGNWFEGVPGDILTRQGEPVENLVYIAWGGVDIEVNGDFITHVGESEFIGEIAVLNAGTASATVRVNKPTHYFAVPGDRLRALVRNKPDLRAQLDFAFAGNIRSKLLATNARLHSVLQAQAGHSSRIMRDTRG